MPFIKEKDCAHADEVLDFLRKPVVVEEKKDYSDYLILVIIFIITYFAYIFTL